MEEGSEAGRDAVEEAPGGPSTDPHSVRDEGADEAPGTAGGDSWEKGIGAPDREYMLANQRGGGRTGDRGVSRVGQSAVFECVLIQTRPMAMRPAIRYPKHDRHIPLRRRLEERPLPHDPTHTLESFKKHLRIPLEGTFSGAKVFISVFTTLASWRLMGRGAVK